MKMLQVIMVVSSLVLAGSFFLPVEADWTVLPATVTGSMTGWAPYMAINGYTVGSSFVTSWAIFAVQIAPYAAGLLAIGMLLLQRQPRMSVALGVLYAVGWIFVGQWTLYVYARQTHLPEYWMLGGGMLLLAGLAAVLASLLRTSAVKALRTLVRILVLASVVQQICSILFMILEDRLPLDYGAVSGMAGAVGMLVATLLYQPEVREHAQPARAVEPVLLQPDLEPTPAEEPAPLAESPSLEKP